MYEVARGKTVEHAGRGYEILKVLDPLRVTARDLETGEIEELAIQVCRPHGTNYTPRVRCDVLFLSPEDRRKIAWRLKIIRPLINKAGRTKAMVEARAKKARKDTSTIYRWLNKYELSRSAYALLWDGPSGGRGKGRLDERVEAIIKAKIDAGIKGRKSRRLIYKWIEKACREDGLAVPCIHTVNNRRQKVPAKTESEAWSKSEAKTQFDQKRGRYKTPKWPLSVVQIDHTKLNIIVLGDLYQEPLGRPWITVAIDVFSRCIIGFYLAMEAPSGYSVGQCLANAILPKEEFLKSLGLAGLPWDNYGMLDVIHADNGPDFRSHMMKEICTSQGMDMIWRPTGKTEYGGHIESLLGSFKDTLSDLPGTTFHNPEERGDYDSAANAIFTFFEFKRWLAQEVVKYNHEIHSSFELTPNTKYLDGLLKGTNDVGGRGIRPAADPRRLRIELLPHFKGTIQRHGIRRENWFYNGSELAGWLNSGEGNRRKFDCHEDYADVSYIYWLDPDTDEYYQIFSDHPPTTKWERRAGRREELSKKKADENENQPLTKKIDKDQEEDLEIARSKTERRQKEMKNIHRKKSPPSPPPAPPPSAPREPSLHIETPEFDFEDIEVGGPDDDEA